MSSLKKISMIAIVMIALIVPALAISDNAAGEVKIDGDIYVKGGFDDRTAGSIVVTLYNSGTEPSAVNIRVESLDGIIYKEMTDVIVPGSETYDVTIKFSVGTTGKQWAKVVIEGDDVTLGEQKELGFEFDVGRSIWSNTWTYVAIIIVIAIVAIAAFIKMRSSPRVPEEAGTFTAMEEERKAGKKKTGKAEREEYKGRKK